MAKRKSFPLKVGQRVRIKHGQSWMAGYVESGTEGTVCYGAGERYPNSPMWHIEWDNLKATEGYLFGVNPEDMSDLEVLDGKA